MQHIGPFVVLFSSNNTSIPEFQWCYLVYNDAAGTWSMHTSPVGEDGVPDWDSDVLTEHPVPEKIQVVAYPESMQQTLTWANAYFAVQGAALLRYSSIETWHYIADNTNGVPFSQEINGHDFQFLTPQAPQREELNEAYASWYARTKSRLPNCIVDALSKCVDPWLSNIDKILAFTNARNLFNDSSSSAYLLTVQLYFNGQQHRLERYLYRGILERLLGLRVEQFQSTVSELLQRGWSFSSMAFYACFLSYLGPKHAPALIKSTAVQQQIVTLLCANDDVFASEIKHIAACDNETRETILAIPDVNAALRRHINSLHSLDALFWRPNSSAYANHSFKDFKKDTIVQAIGMGIVETWITDLDSFNIAKKCTTTVMFSQLVWARPDLLAQSVRCPLDAAEAIHMLLANPTRSDAEILEKITEFVNVLPEDDYTSCLNHHLVYREITHGTITITAEQKMALLKIPRIYDAMSHNTFETMMNGFVMTIPQKELLFDALSPTKIKQFILETDGRILGSMTREQRVCAYATFLAQELQSNPNLFEIMDKEEQRRSAENQRMQPSLFMRIMTHRATPYMGAIFLLAGVALLMMTAQAVLGVSLGVVGGLMLFGSYMSKNRRNPYSEMGIGRSWAMIH